MTLFRTAAGLVFFVCVAAIAAQDPPRVLPPNVLKGLESGEPPLVGEPEEIKPVSMQVPAGSPQPIAIQPTGGVTYSGTMLPTPSVSLSLSGASDSAKEKDLSYRIVIRNDSAAEAHHVYVSGPPAKGAVYKSSKPEMDKTAPPNQFLWKFGTLKPGESKTIEVTLAPDNTSDDIRFTAKVHCEHGAYLDTKLSKPGIKLRKTIAGQIIKDQPFPARIELTNNGKLAIQDILVTETMQPGLEIDSSTPTNPKAVETAPGVSTWKITAIKPGETRLIEYRMVARVPDRVKSEIKLEAHGVTKSDNWESKVAEANMKVEVRGPGDGRALIQTPTPYEVRVQNTGTADLANVAVTCRLPADARVTRQTAGAQFFSDSVQWVLPKLKPNEEKTVRLTVQVNKEGSRVFGFAVRGNPGLEYPKTMETDFYGLPTLDWKSEGDGASSIGRDVSYTVTVTNRGNGPARKVMLRAELPKQVEFNDNATPNFKATQSGITFDSVDIPAGEKATFTVKARAVASGEAIFKFFLVADHMGAQEPYRQEKVTAISGLGAGREQKAPDRPLDRP